MTTAILYTTYGFIMAMIANIIINKRSKKNHYYKIINDLVEDKNKLRIKINNLTEQKEIIRTLLNAKIEFEQSVNRHLANAKTLKVKSDKKTYKVNTK